ncbi:MAG TPA: tetratricopeptide repeat protein [Candidatus Acidoferrum sp.]|nr:tetratricopeptide repeat protein [Candidatus Acidoferrum sp.]
MLLRLPNPAARLAVLVFAFALAAILTFFAIRNARAANQAGLGTRAGYEAAARLEPANPETWYLLGRYWQYTLDEPDPGRAIHNFRRALSLNPRSADAWLDLGAVYESEGDFPAARDAYLQARNAYPVSAAVAWRYGNFLLRQGEVQQAFAEIHRAVYADPKRSAEAFSRCWRVDPDVRAVLDNVIPPDRAAYLDVIRELAAADQLAATLIVWQRLVSIHPRVSPADVILFTDFLLQKGQFADAHRVWQDALLLSDVVTGDPPGSALWDGGFESNVRGGGFAWIFPAPSPGVQAGLDRRQKHSGKQSLRLFFDGKHNTNYEGVCSNAEVRPETTYRFSAWVRTQALTSDEGVRFRLSWFSDSHPSGSTNSQDSRGTQQWTRVEMPWSSGKDVHRARVCVLRNLSRGLDARIQGTAWIDDISLVPVGNPNP